MPANQAETAVEPFPVGDSSVQWLEEGQLMGLVGLEGSASQWVYLCSAYSYASVAL